MDQLEKTHYSAASGSRIRSRNVDDFLRDTLRGQSEVHARVSSYNFKTIAPISEQEPQNIDEASVHESEATEDSVSQETTKRGLGRRALNLVQSVDKWMAYRSAWAINKFSLTPEEYEARRQERKEKYAVQAGDNFRERSSKLLKRNMIKVGERAFPYAVITGIGYAALSKVMPYAVDGFESYMNSYDAPTTPRVVTQGVDIAANAIDYTPVEKPLSEEYNSKAILIGGRGDPSGVMFHASMESQGALGDSAVSTIENPAGIAPVDPVSMEVSADIAARGAVADYDPNSPMVQTIYGYSEGSAGAIDAYNEIVAANGGVKPDNLNLVLIGSPYAQGGFFRSDYVGVAAPVLDSFGIPTDKQVPPGTTVIYSPNDFWANGDNQSFLGMMSQLADLEKGHSVNLNGEFYERVDSEGVRHLIKKDVAHPLVELAESKGMPLPPGVSEILQDIAPVNNGMSDEVPKTNFYAAIDKTADLINQQTGTQLGTELMNNMPREFKDIGHTGLTAINEVPGTVAGIANGTISPQEGIPKIMNQVNDVMQDVGPALNQVEQMAKPFLDMLGGNGSHQNFIPQFQEYIPPTPSAPVAPAPVFETPASTPAPAPIAVTPEPFVVPELPPMPPEVEQMVQQGLPILEDFANGLFAPRP